MPSPGDTLVNDPSPAPPQSTTTIPVVASDNDDGDEEGLFGSEGLFNEPAEFYPPTPPPHSETYTLLSGTTLTLHLVGASPTEAHLLWNGARTTARLFENTPAFVQGKTVLELGAGAGLPSLVSGVLGARRVVVTDFPDVDLLINLAQNIDECEDVFRNVRGMSEGRMSDVVKVKGFVWGSDANPLLDELTEGEKEVGSDGRKGFDVLVLADLMFRHAEHGKLVKTIRETLKKDAASRAYVVFTSYRPWLREKDLRFFELAATREGEWGSGDEGDLVVEKILEERLDKPMFEGDPGDLEVQKTVTGFVVRWKVDEDGGEGGI